MAKAKATVANDFDNYTSDDIKTLPFPLCVQQRPAVYIGPANSNGMLVCIREVVNNSVDEHLAGYCSQIKIVRNSEFSFTVIDNGRGVPFDNHEKGKNVLEVIFGELHAGRNFETKTVYSTGINGVGGSCVCALSANFKATSHRGKNGAFILFENGYKKDLQLTSASKGTDSDKVFSKSSTRIDFEFNLEFFEDGSNVTHEDILKLLKETAYLNSGLTISYEDKTNKFKEVFKYDNGVYNLLSESVKDNIVPVISFESETINDTKIEVAFTYTNSFKGENIRSFCNTINTADGGKHVTGFKRSISQKLLAYIKENGMTKEKVDNEDIYIGLEAVVSVFVFNPKYTTQTKTNLDNNEVNGHVFQYFNKLISDWLNTKPAEMKAIAKKIEIAAKSRIAQKRAIESVKKDSASFISSVSDLAKFSDCAEKRSGRTELFLVEGNSAGGTASEGRDKNFQAVYRLRGKPLNVLDKPLHKSRENNEIDSIIRIIEAGAGDNFDIEKAKFDKVIILADADHDGKHIELLIATMYHEYMKPLIEHGRLFIAVSPLYRVNITGRDPVYIKDAEGLAEFYANEVTSFVKIVKNDKEVTAASKKVTIMDNFIKYQRLIEKTAEDLNMEPHILESVFIQNYNPDEESIEFGDRIETTELPNGNISLVGFCEENFVCLNNIDPSEFMAKIVECYNLLSEIYEYSVLEKNGKMIEESTMFSILTTLFNKFKKTCNITRMKGWGEANSKELWDTVLNPETRTLTRLTLSDDSNQHIRAFMDPKKPGPRKEFLRESFKELLEMAITE